MEKTCTKCLIPLDISEFGKDVRTKDGLKSWCNGCKKAAYAIWFDKNIDRVHEKHAQYRLNKKAHGPLMDIHNQQFIDGILQTSRGLIHKSGDQPCRPSDAAQSHTGKSTLGGKW